MSLRPVSFELPSDIHEMLDHSLVEATELNAKHANTAKYFVEGRSDLFVRCIPGEIVSDALEVGRSLITHGVNVLPYHVVEHNGEEWVVTTKVTGDNLEDALAVNALSENKALTNAVDRNWTGLGKNLIAARDIRSPVTYDVEAVCQYMWGTIAPAAIDEPGVLMVDLPQFTWHTAIEQVYAKLVLSIANGIVEVENTGGIRLHKARSAIEPAIERVDTMTEWCRQLSLASQYVLRHGVELCYADDEDMIWEITDALPKI